MKAEIEKRISEYAAKLNDLNGPDDKRVKKRVLQALGKLKKQLASLDSSTNCCLIEEADVNPGTAIEASDQKVDFKSTDATLSRKHLKAKLKLLNKELADYAQKKQLKLAVKRFSWGVRKGMEPDKHTYANLLNCYVRCGDLDGALQQFRLMSDAKITPNIVIYTTLLKGFCDRGDLSGAQNLLFTEIPNSKLTPGIRTVNTFIRGCTKIGAVNSALQAYRMLQDSAKSSAGNSNEPILTKNKKRKRSNGGDKKEYDDDNNDDAHVDDDELGRSEGLDGNNYDENDGKVSLYESLVALLCQSLDIDQAAALAVEALVSLETAKASKSNNTTDYATIYVNLAKSYLFTGQHKEAEKWIKCAVAALEGSKNSQLRNSMQQNRENQNDSGKDYGNSKKGKDSGKRTRSIDLFLSHKRAELETEVESINECLSVIQSTASQSKSKQRDIEMASKSGFLQVLSRVLHFGFNGNGDFDKLENNEMKRIKNAKVGESQNPKDESKEFGLTTQLIFALRDKFGLDRVELSNNFQGDKMASSSNFNEFQDSSKKKLKLMKKEVVKKMLLTVNSDTGLINYSQLFRDVTLPSFSSPKDISKEEEEEEYENNDDDDNDDNNNDDIRDKRDYKKNVKNVFDLDKLPVNIEICSGSGEWVVSHAAADLYYTSPKNGGNRKKDLDYTNLKDIPNLSRPVPRALWLALELRCDRVYHTICRSILENIVQHSKHEEAQLRNRPSNNINQRNIDSHLCNTPSSFGGLANLAVIGGDASNILPNRIAPSSITSVYINHPEPPERTGGVGDSEGKHLLTEEFFNNIYQILIPHGTCTIVTDNLPYAKSLLQALARTAQNNLKLGNSSSSINPSFVSVPLSSSRNDDKANKRVLEEEITIGAKFMPKNGSVNEKSSNRKKPESGAKLQKLENVKDNDDGDDDSDSDSDSDNSVDGSFDGGYTYINDENAIMPDEIPRIKNLTQKQGNQNKANDYSKVSNKNGNCISDSSVDRGRVELKGAGLKAKAVEIEKEEENEEEPVLQLWRGDSAEANDFNDDASPSHVSSYFDRMWERGQKKRRWFMILKKSK